MKNDAHRVVQHRCVVGQGHPDIDKAVEHAVFERHFCVPVLQTGQRHRRDQILRDVAQIMTMGAECHHEPLVLAGRIPKQVHRMCSLKHPMRPS